MSNPYVEYYNKQIGKGIPGFRGLRYQRGHGLLSSLISKAIGPIFRSITSVDPGKVVKMAADVLKSPGLLPGQPLADDIARIGATATGALINTLQGGKGKKYKRKKYRKKKSVAKKRRMRKRRVRKIQKKRKNKKVLKKRKRKRTKKRRTSKRKTVCKRKPSRKPSRKKRKTKKKLTTFSDAFGA